MKIKRLRRMVSQYEHYAVIQSEGLFGHFFDFVGMPNDSFVVVLARNKRNAVRRYEERHKRKFHSYTDFYMKGLLLHECSKRFGRYCVINKKKEQTFYRL